MDGNAPHAIMSFTVGSLTFWEEAGQAVPPWFFTTLAFVMGAVVGSFLNVCIHRLPRGHSVVNPGSRCYSCGAAVRWFDNIPLLSYLLLRGRCRNCGAAFSSRYWLVECLSALLFVAIWKQFPPGEALAYTVFMSGLIVATFIDLEHYIIPNEITLGGIGAGLILSGLIPALQRESAHLPAVGWSAVGAALGYGLLWGVVELGKRAFGIKKLVLEKPTEVLLRADGIQIGVESDPWEEIFSRESDVLTFDATNVRCGNRTWAAARIRVNWREAWVDEEVFKLAEMGELAAVAREILVPREAMGFGDVKFLAALGAFLGPGAIFFIVLVSSLLGSVMGLAIMLLGRRGWGIKIPYGPYLALAAALWLFGGSGWMSRYMQWIGR